MWIHENLPSKQYCYLSSEKPGEKHISCGCQINFLDFFASICKSLYLELKLILSVQTKLFFINNYCKSTFKFPIINVPINSLVYLSKSDTEAVIVLWWICLFINLSDSYFN